MLEAHTITGAGDMLCRMVARSNADLQRVIDRIVGVEGIVRASTVIALAEPIPYRTLPTDQSGIARIIYRHGLIGLPPRGDRAR